MLDKARSYLGKTFIGTNSSDKGQCVGLFNKVVQDVTGVLYPIQGAENAKSILTANNTRKDLMVQVKNDPTNPNQLPSIGDWVIWGGTWGNGDGHIGCIETVSSIGFTSIEQNFFANKVTRQEHNYSGVIGWVHVINQGDNMTETVKAWYRKWLRREADPQGLAWHTANTKAEIDFVNGARAELHSTIDALVKQRADLQAALANEQNKPPKEVIKEVEKIVEKEVIKEVPVYTHDQETKNMITSIYNYFAGQFKTFQKYIKK